MTGTLSSQTPSPQDTVARAAGTPDRPQPYSELGLTTEEYVRIAGMLGRRPTDAELAIYSVMWSEHCSYKSSRVHLRQFAEKAPRTAALLAGIGHNAGVVDIGQGYAVTFKLESHNHPSYVEPFQGAATGVGGIVRDILAMGARPVAVMDALRFGPADAPDTRRVLPGVVGGISFYGNCLGLPNIGGELAFDPCYAGNPLVNALCLGVMRHEDLKLAAATGPGNAVVLVGAKTGPDGIGGASVLASASFGGGAEGSKRPSVQVGDPFKEKLLIECCLELYAAGLVLGIQDLGAAGVACATTELAAGGGAGVGMRVRLDAVPLRDASLGPAEILMSESQERMMAIVEPAGLERFLSICAKWDVEATVIGEVTGTGRLEMSWHGDVVVDIPPRSAADEGPLYHRPAARPPGQQALQDDDPSRLARADTGDELRKTILAVLGSADAADKSWVTEQYDHYVRGETVLAMPQDAGLIRVDEHTSLGVALAVDGNGRYCLLDPYAGTQLALAEAYRNVAATGARPLAVTNCLNFGSPEDPGVMWQFTEAVRGLADCVPGPRRAGDRGQRQLLQPDHGRGDPPDPDRRRPRRPRRREQAAGDRLWPAGLRRGAARPRRGGVRRVAVGLRRAPAHRGRPPAVDLDAERNLAAVLVEGAARGLLAAAHDLSDGGLAIALAECCLAGGQGCAVRLPGDPFTGLFGESAARAVVAVVPGAEAEFAALCSAHGVPAAELGVTGGSTLEVVDCFTIPLDELAAAHRGTLPALFG